MNGFFLCASDVTIGETAVYALVGFVIVLLVLALLIGIFYLSGFVFKSKLFNKTEQPKSPSKTPETSEVDQDEETVAAITAAIALILAEEAGESDVKPDFVIKRIARKK